MRLISEPLNNKAAPNFRQYRACLLWTSVKHMAWLTAERGFIGAVGTVWRVVAHPAEVNTHTVSRALPLPAGTAERRRATVSLIAAIPTVVITVTHPGTENTVPIITAELRGEARARWARVVFVWAIFTVWVPITFPVWGNTSAVWLALKLTLVVTHAGRPRGWKGQRSC